MSKLLQKQNWTLCIVYFLSYVSFRRQSSERRNQPEDRELEIGELGGGLLDSNVLVFTQYPHWDEILHKVEFTVKKPSAYTRGKG